MDERDRNLNTQPAEEIMEIEPKNDWWKYVIVVIAAVVLVGGGYYWLNPKRADALILNSIHSFTGQIGSAAQTAFANIFSNGKSKEKLVEVIDVNKPRNVSASPAAVNDGRSGVAARERVGVGAPAENGGALSSNAESVVNAQAQNFKAAVPNNKKQIQPVINPAENQKTEPDINKTPTQKITQPLIASKNCAFNTSQSPSREKVIINEVAWMGGSETFGLTANDEWIELKNISSAEVDISGWQLIDKAEKIKINFSLLKKTKLGVSGFILLERKEEAVPNIPADLIYSGALSNTDEGLRLFDSQCNLIDEVFANPKWPAGDNTAKKTMERKGDFSWYTSSIVGGTPKKENSTPSVTTTSGSSGTGTPTNNQQQTTNNQQQSPAKILINEIQISPTGNRFIELYNPNNYSINLTNWYLQRKTQTGSSFGSLVSKTYFEGKTISANGYFLVSRDILENADIILSGLTLTGSNAIQLKNSNGEVADKIGWGQASDCENNCAPEPLDNQSIQRKFHPSTSPHTNDFDVGASSGQATFVDTDNNAQDFEIQTCPSPKAQSKTCPSAQTNQAPGAFFVYTPQSPLVGEEITFNAASSTDDGQIISYQWDFGDGVTLTILTAAITHIYSQAGDYSVSLIVFDDKNISSTAFSATILVSPDLSQPAGVGHLVISEIQVAGKTADDEFIELYNPTGNNIDISNWSIQYKSATGLTFYKKNFIKDTIISAHNFFLIVNTAANQELKNLADMTHSTFSLSGGIKIGGGGNIFLVNNQKDLTSTTGPTIVDKVAYGLGDSPETVAALLPLASTSIERKANVDSTAESMFTGVDKYLGNGWDSDNNSVDFVLQTSPNPQNSSSSPEPREAQTNLNADSWKVVCNSSALVKN